MIIMMMAEVVASPSRVTRLQNRCARRRHVGHCRLLAASATFQTDLLGPHFGASRENKQSGERKRGRKRGRARGKGREEMMPL